MTSHLDQMVPAFLSWAPKPLAHWYSPDALNAQAREVMEQQAGWIGDEEFGAGFRDAVATVDVPDALAWANRWVDLGDGEWAVVGIRFRGMDVERPFVDIVATSLEPSLTSIRRIIDAIEPLYRPFAPRGFRVVSPDPDGLAAQAATRELGLSVHVDQYVVAGLVSELLQRLAPAGMERVVLRPTDAQHAATVAATLYEAALAQRPDQLEWARPSTADELEEPAADGLVLEVLVNGAPAGIVAVSRRDDLGMTGFVVEEIVLDTAHRGQRLAAPVLRHVLMRLPAQPGDTLWGTIHPQNATSLRNARSIGREVVAAYTWITPAGAPAV